MSPAPADYVDVAQRIKEFKAKYPDGVLGSGRAPRLFTVGDKTFIAYHALAYRTSDDERPGEGWAWEPVPGPTPFTKDSELQNAETSAWGRAIVALGFETKHVASANEIRNRTASEDSGEAPSAPQKKKLNAVLADLAKTEEREDWKAVAKQFCETHFSKDSVSKLTKREMSSLLEELDRLLVLAQAEGGPV